MSPLSRARWARYTTNYEIKVFRDHSTWSVSLGQGTTAGGAKPATNQGHLISFGNTEERAIYEVLGCEARGPNDVPFDRRTGVGYVAAFDGDYCGALLQGRHTVLLLANAYGGLSQGAHRHLEHRAHLARDNGDTTPYGDPPLATSSFRVFHARRMSNAIIVADSRAVERYLGLRSPRRVGASVALHPIVERAGY